MAQQAHQLLYMIFKPRGLEQIRQYYVSKLQQRDLANTSRRIKWPELIAQFNAHYNKSYPKNVNSYIHPENEHSWLHKLLRSPRVTCHPLRHILVLGFLNESVGSLLYNISVDTDHQQKKSTESQNKIVSIYEVANHRIDWNSRNV
ncbi:TnsD family Tn7-like transposition protein [Paenibacillus agaridevorans]|uniref:TnsD family Tn7-like transposition protein n=1 Tax=Paenibacillus agaridevorans TaxID=171404 RepID=UPI000D58CD4F